MAQKHATEEDIATLRELAEKRKAARAAKRRDAKNPRETLGKALEGFQEGQ